MLRYPAQLSPIADLSTHFEGVIERVKADRCPNPLLPLSPFTLKEAALELAEAYLWLAGVAPNATYSTISEAFESKISSFNHQVQTARNPYSGNQVQDANRLQLTTSEQILLAAKSIKLTFQQEASTIAP